ncbi:uncharacterized protein Tco025E_02401 [Trypanosoma conorhini]|uniref:Uncharacterized protein n=1 Tax=Trypanosoma conorhini TaxID=83891 RepID=A0A3R7LD88_9TRYP|nr:uncharacterized protein Tco025E_02401 [Trypanosoma conorhini]RNF24925.1 hypothetical protein Tco025E_02401 [Trypanosoma conorhini]
MTHDEQQPQCTGAAGPCGSAGHDTMMALHRLEDAAATLHAESRKLRRAILAKQRLASKLLLGDADAAVAVDGLCPTATGHAWPAASHHAVGAQRHWALAAQHRSLAEVLRRKAELAELWERLVVRAWYKRVVVAGFYERVLARLSGFDRRLQRAASVLRPGRRWRGGTPPALAPLRATAPRRPREPAAAAVGPASTLAGVRAAAGEAVDAIEACGTGGGRAACVRRRRPLRTIIHLFTSVVRDYAEQQRTHGGCDVFSNTGEHLGGGGDGAPWVNPLVPFTLEQLAEAMHHIFTGSVGVRWPCLGDPPSAGTPAESQKEALLQALAASFLLQRHMETWVMCHFQPQEKLLRYRHYAQAVTGFMQERSRATRDLLVTRRQQQERDEARWQGMRARAMAALHPLPADAAAADDSLHHTEHGADVPIDKGECMLWLVVDSLRQQSRAESAALDPTHS